MMSGLKFEKGKIVKIQVFQFKWSELLSLFIGFNNIPMNNESGADHLNWKT